MGCKVWSRELLILKSSFQNDELDLDHKLPYRVIGNSMIARAVYQHLLALIKVSRLPPSKSAPQSSCILLADSWMHDHFLAPLE